MGVMFTADVTPDGFRTSCAWDDTVYLTWDAALAAARAHPEGGCANGKAFFDGIEHLDDRAQLDREDEVQERTGRWAAACVNERIQWVDAIYNEEPPEVQMSQSNAADVLRVLGFTSGHDIAGEAGRERSTLVDILTAMAPDDVEWCGSVDPDDLEARILVAEALVDDAARPTAREVFESGSVLVDMGRAAGYVRSRLADLTTLAEFARQRNARVVWS
jgi:hypothetical protein